MKKGLITKEEFTKMYKTATDQPHQHDIGYGLIKHEGMSHPGGEQFCFSCQKTLIEIIDQAYSDGYKVGSGDLGKRTGAEYVGFEEKIEEARREEREKWDNEIEKAIKMNGVLVIDGKMYGLQKIEKMVVVNTGETINISSKKITNQTKK